MPRDNGPYVLRSAQSAQVGRLASLLEAYYATATSKAGWSPDWANDAERILDALTQCTCVWKGKTQGPRGWVELITKRDPACSVHGDHDGIDVALDQKQASGCHETPDS